MIVQQEVITSHLSVSCHFEFQVQCTIEKTHSIHSSQEKTDKLHFHVSFNLMTANNVYFVRVFPSIKPPNAQCVQIAYSCIGYLHAENITQTYTCRSTYMYLAIGVMYSDENKMQFVSRVPGKWREVWSRTFFFIPLSHLHV